MSNELARLFLENPILLTGSDWLMKSLVILVLAFFIIHVTKRAENASSVKHLFWLHSIACLGLIPVAHFIIDAIPTAAVLSGNMFTLTTISEYPVRPILIPASKHSLADLLLYFYLLLTVLLLLRLLIGVYTVLRISNRAILVSASGINELSSKLAKEFGISRSVKLKLSRDVTSPFSYGIFFPEIILPGHVIDWSESTLESVLMHELTHIKRLDWLTMLICHVVTCAYWINPLCWLALNRVNEEAESSCDSAVLAHGLDAKSYAESLVYVARQSRDGHRMLVQMMADRRQLPKRINQILEGSVNNSSVTNKVKLQLILFLMIMVGLLSNLQLISAQSTSVTQSDPYAGLSMGTDGSFSANSFDSRYFPIEFAVPQYPIRAQARGITGWNLVSFTVNEDGNVDEGSILIVDSEPPNIFNRSSIRAAAQLKFRPPRVNGVNVAINGFEIAFRYDLDEDGRPPVVQVNREYLPLNHINPQYPLAASKENLEGYVLVEFTVTDQGMPSDIVVLDRSPSDIFDASAINAAERFRFDPRIVGGEPVEATGAQYLFRFKPGD